MKIESKTIDALLGLGRTLPNSSNIELCITGADGERVCHRFYIRNGEVHHSGSHTHNAVVSGEGNLTGRLRDDNKT